jgi:hypothetical protein
LIGNQQQRCDFAGPAASLAGMRCLHIQLLFDLSVKESFTEYLERHDGRIISGKAWHATAPLMVACHSTVDGGTVANVVKTSFDGIKDSHVVLTHFKVHAHDLFEMGSGWPETCQSFRCLDQRCNREGFGPCIFLQMLISLKI